LIFKDRGLAALANGIEISNNPLFISAAALVKLNLELILYPKLKDRLATPL
jgi:hypothetical protein